jgi:hypothetical protein
MKDVTSQLEEEDGGVVDYEAAFVSLRDFQTEGMKAQIAELLAANEELAVEKAQRELEMKLAGNEKSIKIVNRLLHNWAHKEVHLGWRKWRENHLEIQEQEEREAKIAQFGRGLLQRWKNGTVVRVFAALRQYALDESAERHTHSGLMKRFAARWMTSRSREAFSHWLQICKMSNNVGKALRRFSHSSMELAVEKWRKVLRWEASEQRIAALTASYETLLQSEREAHEDTKLDLSMTMDGRAKQHQQQLIQQKATQVLRRWKNALLYRVFDGLLRYAEESKRNRYLISKFVQTWKLKGVRACVNAWVELRDQRQLCRRVMQKLIGRYSKQGILAGWIRWREWWYRWNGWMQSLEAARDAHAAAEETASQDHSVMEAAARSEFEGAILVEQRKLQASLIRRFVARWLHNTRRDAFSQWSQLSRAMKQVLKVKYNCDVYNAAITRTQMHSCAHAIVHLHAATLIPPTATP